VIFLAPRLGYFKKSAVFRELCGYFGGEWGEQIDQDT